MERSYKQDGMFKGYSRGVKITWAPRTRPGTPCRLYIALGVRAAAVATTMAAAAAARDPVLATKGPVEAVSLRE